MDRLGQDLRIAIRGLRRSLTFTVATVLILGLGIGMAAAMVTTFRTILLRRLPVTDQNLLAVLWTYQVPSVEFSVQAGHLPEILRASHTMHGLAGVAHWGAADLPLTDGDRTIVLRTLAVTANYFDVLGVRPVVGRFFKAEDADSGAPEVRVLSYRAWQLEFGGSPSAIGREVTDPTSHRAVTIIGIAPSGLDYPPDVQAWLPIGRADMWQVFAVARLKPGVPIDAARQDFFRVARGIESDFKLTGAKAETFATAVVGNVRPMLVALTAAVALLLAIACVNVGTLFLARIASRAHEFAVRRALGAGSGDIARQFLVESVIVAVAAGTLGIICARAILAGIVTLAPPEVPRLGELRLHGGLLSAAIAVTAVAVLLFGGLPALATTRFGAAASLQLGPRSGAETRRRRGVRQWLVGSQVALALVMLTGAGLLARSLLSLEHLSLGYQTQHLSIGEVAFDDGAYDSLDKVTRLSEQVLRSVRAIPGVTSATTLRAPPFIGPNFLRAPVEAEGQPPADSGVAPNWWPFEVIGSEYFQTFGIPVLRGRGLLDIDRQDAPSVAVVSQSVARRLWPGEDPIGKRFRFPPSGCDSTCDQWRTVVGVVPDTRFRALREAWPTLYFPQRQMQDPWQGLLAIRSAEGVATLAPAVRAALHRVDPTLAVFDLKSMDDVVDGSLAEPRLVALLVVAFGIVALVLAAVGLYGVIASAVRDRTHEIGVRMALGATPKRIRDSVLRQTLIITCAGAAAGLLGAVTVTRLLRALLFGVSPTDPITLASACVVLLAAGAVAAYVPARRATRVDPVRALRAE